MIHRIACVLAILPTLAFAAPAAPGPYARQLQRECDELLGLAVRRPYGWAWTNGKPDPKPKGGAHVVTMDPPGTAGAGFVLYWSGDLLDNTAYKQAAYQAVRGIGAAQRPTGQIPAHPTFLTGAAGGRDEVALAADRGPTRAMIGLTLSMLEDAGGTDDLLRRTAQRGVTWMLRQQAPLGGWPLGYPPATAPKDAMRVMRVDQPDFRDSTLALMLAADVTQDAVCRAAAERAMTSLLRMRIGNVSRIGAPLWAAIYTPDTFVTDRIAGYPAGVDVLGSRNAMQTVMGAFLILGNPPQDNPDDPRPGYDQVVRHAAAAVAKLPTYEQSQWLRNYYYDVQATPPPPTQGAPLFDRPPPAQVISPAQQVGSWGMRSVLRAAAAMNGKSREAFAEQLAGHLPVHQRIAAALCGLDDQPFSVDWPTNAAEAEKFLVEFDATFKTLADTTPDPLPERLQRMWTLWLRARIEIKFGK